VGACDEAIHIGPSPAKDSYLAIDKIVEACRETGADAVHPGYGFLSQNPKFPKWVSPSLTSGEVVA
jgi:propionyl-CoA carboxylase alpha chain